MDQHKFVVPDEDFEQFRLLNIEEAEFILFDATSYVNDDIIPIEEKIIRTCDLVDFFILEGEKEIVKDLIKVENALYIKKLIEGLDYM
jgi:hypothetical protein